MSVSPEELYALTTDAAQGPLESDISDYSDEWCAGFVAGQVNALQVLHRRLDYREWQRATEAPIVYSGTRWASEGTP